MALPFPAGAQRAPAHLPPERLAEALAVLVSDLVAALPTPDPDAALERLANRLDGRGRVPDGSEAAQLLGALGAVLMSFED